MKQNLINNNISLNKIIKLLILVFIELIFWLPISYLYISYAQNIDKYINPIDIFNEAYYQQKSKNYTMARAKYEEFLKKFPNHELSRRAKFELATVLKNLNENEKALKLLEETIKMGKGPKEYETIQSVKAMAKIYYDTLRFKQGIELLEPIYKENLFDPELSIILSKFYIASGKIEEAKLLLESSLIKTQDSLVFSELLNLATKLNNVEQLIKFLDENIANVNKKAYLDFVSDCFITLNQRDKAIKILENYDKLDHEIQLIDKLANLYYQQNDYNKAMHYFKILLNKNSDNWQYIKAVGNCYIKLGDRESAINIWKKHINTGSYSEESYSNLVNILLENRLYDEALKVFDEARAKLNNQTLFAEEKASILEVSGKEYQALAEYFLALANSSYKPEIFNKLYNKKSANFDLKQLLINHIKAGNLNYSLRKALVEYYYREQNTNNIEELLQLANNDDILLTILIDHVKYYLQSCPNKFTLELLEYITKTYLSSSYSYDLVYTALQNYTSIEKIKLINILNLASYLLTNNTEIEPIYKNKLALIVAKILFMEFRKLNDSKLLLEYITKDETQQFSEPEILIEAYFLLMKIYTIQNSISEASIMFKKASEQLKSIGYQENDAKILFEEAWFLFHTFKYEEALTKLRKIVENYFDSEYTNEAIDLAATITFLANNINIDVCKDFIDATKLFYNNNLESAEKIYKDILKLASGSHVLPYVKSILLSLDYNKLILSDNIDINKLENFKNKVYEFVNQYPNFWGSSNIFYCLVELIYFIMNNYYHEIASFYKTNIFISKNNSSKLEINNSSTSDLNTNSNSIPLSKQEAYLVYKDFIERYGYDFRVRKVKNWQKILLELN